MRGNEHVVRFNVAVYQASAVHLVQAHEHRVHHGGSRMRGMGPRSASSSRNVPPVMSSMMR